MRYLTIFMLFIGILSGGMFAQGGEAELADRYYRDGEYESALGLYQKLQKKDKKSEHYNRQIAGCYERLFQFGEGIVFLDEVLKKQPSAYEMEIIKAHLQKLNGEVKEAEKTLENLIENKLMSEKDFVDVGRLFYQRKQYDESLETYLQGRKKLRSGTLFSSELANLYAIDGQYGAAATEYLNRYYENPTYFSGIQIRILNLVGPDSADEVEKVLLDAVQSDQKDLGLRTLVYEFYLLNKDFYEAFLQVRSIDKYFKEQGQRVFDFAMTMRNNQEYQLSNKALDYVIKTHPSSPKYMPSYMEKSVNSELEAFEAIPLDTNALRSAVNAYDDLFDQFGRKIAFFDAMYRKSNLCAVYLNDLDAAKKELQELDPMPINKRQRAKADLLMGDIFLMQKDYNKAKLKYAEVQGSYKDEQLGAMAKFREGRLSYFAGDFELAQARLKTIKDNTSNDISNDAIKLSLTIQDNSGLDTTTVPLEKFAQAQLLVFQRDYDVALSQMDSILFQFPNHSLTDEIYFEKANIYIQKNELDQAIKYLDKVLAEFPDDILGDDALYTKARIHDYSYDDKAKAKELYMTFLRSYTGSLYLVEVRRRIRELRKG